MTTLTRGETQSLVFCLVLIMILAVLELVLLMVLISLHQKRQPAPFWRFLEGVWRRIVPAAETALGATLIAASFLGALTPAGRRRQREVEAAYSAQQATERDARIHRNTVRFFGQP